MGRDIGEVLGGPEVNSENIECWRASIAGWRENKFTQLLALKAAKNVRIEAESQEMWGHVIELWWEQVLVGKHLFMFARDHSRLPMVQVLQRKGLELMEEGVFGAQDVINEHAGDADVDEIGVRQGRFAGDAFLAAGKYEEAVGWFDESIGAYEKMDDPGKRVNALEIKGFKAEALIRMGKIDEGVELGLETYELYQDGDGGVLKDRDYYTWAVWRSGCAVKMVRGLIDSRSVGDLSVSRRREVLGTLKMAYRLLEFPEDVKESFGDLNFRIRKDEFHGLWSELENEGYVEGEIQDN